MYLRIKHFSAEWSREWLKMEAVFAYGPDEGPEQVRAYIRRTAVRAHFYASQVPGSFAGCDEALDKVLVRHPLRGERYL